MMPAAALPRPRAPDKCNATFGGRAVLQARQPCCYCVSSEPVTTAVSRGPPCVRTSLTANVARRPSRVPGVRAKRTSPADRVPGVGSRRRHQQHAHGAIATHPRRRPRDGPRRVCSRIGEAVEREGEYSGVGVDVRPSSGIDDAEYPVAGGDLQPNGETRSGRREPVRVLGAHHARDSRCQRPRRGKAKRSGRWVLVAGTPRRNPGRHRGHSAPDAQPTDGTLPAAHDRYSHTVEIMVGRRTPKFSCAVVSARQRRGETVPRAALPPPRVPRQLQRLVRRLTRTPRGPPASPPARRRRPPRALSATDTPPEVQWRPPTAYGHPLAAARQAAAGRSVPQSPPLRRGRGQRGVPDGAAPCGAQTFTACANSTWAAVSGDTEIAVSRPFRSTCARATTRPPGTSALRSISGKRGAMGCCSRGGEHAVTEPMSRAHRGRGERRTIILRRIGLPNAQIQQRNGPRRTRCAR
jgi:hypothetical protein